MLGRPAYCVFTDKTLDQLVMVCPRNAEQLQSVSGFGAKKVSEYGDGIIYLCAGHQNSPGGLQAAPHSSFASPSPCGYTMSGIGSPGPARSSGVKRPHASTTDPLARPTAPMARGCSFQLKRHPTRAGFFFTPVAPKRDLSRYLPQCTRVRSSMEP
jgi:hypothetical protein